MEKSFIIKSNDLRDVFKVCEKVIKNGEKKMESLGFIQVEVKDGFADFYATDSFRFHTTRKAVAESEDGIYFLKITKIPKEVIEVKITVDNGKLTYFGYGSFWEESHKVENFESINFQQLVPTNESVFEISVNAQFLEDLGKVLKDCKDGRVNMKFYNKNSIFVVENDSSKAYVLPMYS